MSTASQIRAHGQVAGEGWLLRVTKPEDPPGHWQWLCSLHWSYISSDWRSKIQTPLTPRVRAIVENIVGDLGEKYRYEDVSLEKKYLWGLITRKYTARYVQWEAGPVFRDREGFLRFRAWPLFVHQGWKQLPGSTFKFRRAEVTAEYQPREHEHVETNIQLYPLTQAQAAYVGVAVNDDFPERLSPVYWGTSEDWAEILAWYGDKKEAPGLSLLSA